MTHLEIFLGSPFAGKDLAARAARLIAVEQARNGLVICHLKQ